MGEFAEFIVPDDLLRRRERQRAQKKQRYHADEEYRESKRAAARSRYVPAKKKKSGGRGRNKPRPYTLPDGRVILLIGLGQAADQLGCSKKTLRNYEDKGVIPLNRLVDSKGRRWYPREFVAWLAPMFAEQSKLREPLWCLRQRVERAWMHIIEEGNMPILNEMGQEQAK